MGEHETPGPPEASERPKLDPEFTEAEDARKHGFVFPEEEVLAEMGEKAKSLRYNDERMNALMGKPELLKKAGHIIAEAWERPVSDADSEATAPESHASLADRVQWSTLQELVDQWRSEHGRVGDLKDLPAADQEVEHEYHVRLERLRTLGADWQAILLNHVTTETENAEVANALAAATLIEHEVANKKLSFLAVMTARDWKALDKYRGVTVEAIKKAIIDLEKHTATIRHVLQKHPHQQ